MLGNTLSARHDLYLKIPLVCLCVCVCVSECLSWDFSLSVTSTGLLRFGQNDLTRIMLGIWRTQPIDPVPSRADTATKSQDNNMSANSRTCQVRKQRSEFRPLYPGGRVKSVLYWGRRGSVEVLLNWVFSGDQCHSLRTRSVGQVLGACGNRCGWSLEKGVQCLKLFPGRNKGLPEASDFWAWI